ncbi:Uncharacterized protein Fot_26628 [Forsythia ovata]|uniref:Uncharacterized protein n=1 Tax=Forsythia ovata TaxID=205694 RepID=A0ABD1UCF0_9LAMI
MKEKKGNELTEILMWHKTTRLVAESEGESLLQFCQSSLIGPRFLASIFDTEASVGLIRGVDHPCHEIFPLKDGNGSVLSCSTVERVTPHVIPKYRGDFLNLYQG